MDRQPRPARPAVPPGWYPDPCVAGAMRWWDGTTWTAQQYGPAPPNHDYDWLVPVNRDVLAIIAGYLGLLSLIPNPFTSAGAMVCGVLALGRIKHSAHKGRGRAIFGIVMGALSMGFFALILIAGQH